MSALIENLQALLAGPAALTSVEDAAIRQAIDQLTPDGNPVTCEVQAVQELIAHFASSDSERTTYHRSHAGGRYSVEVKRVLA